jgi:hypothetical protein
MKALSLVAVLAAGCGDDSGSGPDAGPSGPPREVITENVPLVVTEIVEAILVGGPTDFAHVQMSAGGALIDWNLHGHANGSTQIVTEALKVPDVDYLFAPSAHADWYLLIRNRGQTDVTVQLTIELYGDMTWSGWQ